MGEENHNVSYDTTSNNIIISHPSVNENSKTNNNHKKRKTDQTGKKPITLSILRLDTRLLTQLKKLKRLVFPKSENLTKVKVKNPQEIYLNFANLAIQKFCDDNELDMNDVNTMLYACAKRVESKLGFKLKKK